jgi:hypothetical protein
MKWIRGMATSRSFFRNMKLNQKMLWLKSDRGATWRAGRGSVVRDRVWDWNWRSKCSTIITHTARTTWLKCNCARSYDIHHLTVLKQGGAQHLGGEDWWHAAPASREEHRPGSLCRTAYMPRATSAKMPRLWTPSRMHAAGTLAG